MLDKTTLRTRLNWHGGVQQIDRMNKDKLRSLQAALWYSYQGCNIKLSDGRIFRALINVDKLKPDYEDKVLSIPFKARRIDEETLQLDKNGEEEVVGIQPGDTFIWLSNSPDIPDTKWLVYLQNMEETAYFRAELRECNQMVQIDGKEYIAWFKGPDQDEIEWHKKGSFEWNGLSYSRVMYITRDENTLRIFKRFEQFYFDENDNLIHNPEKKGHKDRWEVQAVNQVYGDGIIRVAFKEYFGETVPLPDPEPEIEVPENAEELPPEIIGKDEVYPYDRVDYVISVPIEGATWSVDNLKLVQIREQDDPNKLSLYIKTGKKGTFTITYGDLTKVIQIKSL